MPELPEVETIRRALTQHVQGKRLDSVTIFEPRLRWPVSGQLNQYLQGQMLERCERRGKYLLFYFETGILLIHLGMSGSIRMAPINEFLQKHDHLQWDFGDFCLRLNDPRRFGSVIWHPFSAGPIMQHPLLCRLGVEPFDPLFTAEYLHQHLSCKKKSIKQALLDGHVVVGIGNIYCSESLYLAGINPKILASKLSKQRCVKLHAAIIQTLEKALQSGGSTIKDFTDPSGKAGAYFELHANVYGREHQACHGCGSPIRKITQGQRATYYCTKCQH